MILSRLLGLSSVALCLAAACQGPVSSSGPAHTAPEPAALEAQTPPEAGTALATALNLSDAFEQLVADVGPAVVSVRVFANARRRALRQGSGVVVDADGTVVTNHHVVVGAERYEVVLHDGTPVEAQLLGSDAAADVAVLRVEAPGTHYVALDRGAQPAVGAWVLAFGNPRGLGPTVTSGILSGRGRSDLGIALYEDFLQTDAAINPGNSGGPLVDLRGRVVGINTARGTVVDGSLGLGFAIPAAMVCRVVDDILDGGGVERGWLGVRMIELPASRRAALGLDRRGAVLLEDVLRDSPAERAGLLEGDVVVDVDGTPVADSQQVLNAIGARRPGERLLLGVLREGQALDVEVTLARRR